MIDALIAGAILIAGIWLAWKVEASRRHDAAAIRQIIDRLEQVELPPAPVRGAENYERQVDSYISGLKDLAEALGPKK